MVRTWGQHFRLFTNKYEIKAHGSSMTTLQSKIYHKSYDQKLSFTNKQRSILVTLIEIQNFHFHL